MMPPLTELLPPDDNHLCFRPLSSSASTTISVSAPFPAPVHFFWLSRNFVNVLMHTADVVPTADQLLKIQKLKRDHSEQDNIELFHNARADHEESGIAMWGSKGRRHGRKKSEDLPRETVQANIDTHKDTVKGGALWDIFRRQDVPMLEEYLKKHHKEFRHIYGCPVTEVVHPIHDQSLYLSAYHKAKLKEEFGVEPWTFVQRLGEAVFIPAGCPHQVRNLKSCMKVALDFVSPENLGECIRLTEEFRSLPQNHRAKEDKLEVMKMALHALKDAVAKLRGSPVQHPSSHH